MKKILIPTDFSRNAENALKYAIQLTENMDVKLHVLNVVEVEAVPVEVPVVDTFGIQQKLELAKKRLQEFIHEGKELAEMAIENHDEIESDIQVGISFNRICDFAKDEGMDTIIMGTRGKNSSQVDKILGTVSTEVVKRAKCPVLLVPEDYTFTGISTLAFASNLLESDPFELWKAMNLLSPHQAVIHILHITKKVDPSEAPKMELFKKYIEENSPSIQTVFHEIKDPSVDETIVEMAGAYEADMLIMYKTPRTLWDRLFKPSHTVKIVPRIDLPLLIMK